MTLVAIPQWSVHGVIPPNNPTDPRSTDRSPYNVALTDVIHRFASTSRRCEILNGFLAFRKALHSAGLFLGFQWVDGSFLEDIEHIEDREPRDIDVVTFFRLPNGQTQKTMVQDHSHLFTRTQTKETFHVDAYFVHLSASAPEFLVDRTVYWYSLWSHRRNEEWKGFVQIDLSPAEDSVAIAALEKLVNEGDAQ